MKKTTLLICAASALLLAHSTIARAQDRVTMETAAGVEEPFSFEVNPGARLSVDWGDGNVVELSAPTGAVTGTLKGSTVTLEADALTRLDCSSAKLTGLDVSGAPGLLTLYCADNQLSTLTLTSNTALIELDCSSNALSKLSLSKQKALLELNCSDNLLTTLTVTYCSGLKRLLCGDNSLSVLTVSALTDLETLWCERNRLTALVIDANKKLSSLVCDENLLTRIKGPATGLPELTDFWCRENQLTTLALAGSAKLKTLNCENNLIASLTLTPLTESALSFYLGGNKLNFSQMYSAYHIDNYFCGPQDLFSLSATEVNIGEEVECPDMRKDGEGSTVAPVYTWINEADNSTLAKGSTKDYQAITSRSYAFKFKKAFDGVHCLITSKNFPDVTLQSTTLRVKDPLNDGIVEHTRESGFTYNAVGGALYMTAEKALPVSIYTTDGKLVWTGTVGQGGTRVQLGHGLFLVNQIKVAL